MGSWVTWLEKGVQFHETAEFTGKSCVLGFEALICELCGLFLLSRKANLFCETVGTGLSQNGKGTW